jgi:hypothetical protein
MGIQFKMQGRGGILSHQCTEIRTVLMALYRNGMHFGTFLWKWIL